MSEIKVSYSLLRKYVFGYLLLPLLIFAAGFLRFYISIPVIATLVFAYYKAVKTENTDELRSNSIGFSKIGFVLFVAISLLWCYFAGLSGHWYQSSDWNCRNAILRDLLAYDWPVRYDNGNSLCYYIGFWLPAATIGKFFKLFITSDTVIWEITQAAMYLWATTGVCLTLLMTCIYCKADKKKKAIAIASFILFSGLDILGLKVVGKEIDEGLHIEWWAAGMFQFSSITTQLFWTFNQAIAAWIATMAVLHEKDERNYLLIGLGCFICGPIPFIGLVVLMLAKCVVRVIKSVVGKSSFKNMVIPIISISNVSLCAIVFPVLASFYLSNAAVNATETGSEDIVGLIGGFYYFIHAMFILIEVFVYSFPLLKGNSKNPLLYVATLTLFFVPYIYIGSASDFCMRASIPALVVLSLLTGEKIVGAINNKTLFKSVSCIVLCVVFLIGCVTPGVELYRGFYHVIEEGTVNLADNSIETFADNVGGNFVCVGCEETAFYKYFAKSK